MVTQPAARRHPTSFREHLDALKARRDLREIHHEKATRGSAAISRIMVTDADIDPTDLRNVMWAWMTRCHPAHDRQLLDDVPIMPINPVYDLGERQACRGPVAVLNCLLSTGPDAPLSTAFADNYPAALRDRTLARWGGA